MEPRVHVAVRHWPGPLQICPLCRRNTQRKATKTFFSSVSASINHLLDVQPYVQEGNLQQLAYLWFSSPIILPSFAGRRSNERNSGNRHGMHAFVMCLGHTHRTIPAAAPAAAIHMFLEGGNGVETSEIDDGDIYGAVCTDSSCSISGCLLIY